MGAIIKLFIISIYYGVTLASECPNNGTVGPCRCLVDTIHCGGHTDIDIHQIFKNLSNLLEGKDKSYQAFYLNNTSVTELPDNAFSGIQFKQITIDSAYNLTHIHSNAFNGSQATEVNIMDTPVDNNGPDYDIYKAINTLTNLTSIGFYNTSIRYIPDSAFGHLKNLAHIDMEQGKLKSVGKHAFRQLDKLEVLGLIGNEIDYIADEAFAFDDWSTGPDAQLSIFLVINKLNSTSFRKEIFDGISNNSEISRKVMLYLNGNELSYLDEKTFANFLAQNFGNQMEVTRIDCNDCRNYWIIKYFKFQLGSLKCDDDLSCLYDKKHLQNLTKCAIN